MPCCRPCCGATAILATTIPFPRPSAYFASELAAAHAYDPDKAKFHLKQAGLSQASTLPSGPERSMLAVSIRPCSTRNTQPRRALTFTVDQGINGRLLERCLEREAFLRFRLVRPPDRRPDADPGLFGRSPPGTRPIGSMSVSIRFWSRPAPKSTPPSAGKCMSRCSA